jgi:hypothetical protein
MDPIELFNQHCKKNGLPIFPVTPLHLHQCSDRCVFFNIDLRLSICTSSRQIHQCGDTCPYAKIEENIVCGLTRRTIGPRLDYRYFDGTTSFTPRRRHAQLNSHQIKTIIESTLSDIINGKGRILAEESRNRRLARQELVTITKHARQNRLHRGNWLIYYELFIKNSMRHNRYIPNAVNIANLTQLIYKFYLLLYPTTIPVQRVLVSFTAVCFSELAVGTSAIFPLVPWIAEAAPSHANIYSLCILITCRGMTATLMDIITKATAVKPPLVFPLQ